MYTLLYLPFLVALFDLQHASAVRGVALAALGSDRDPVQPGERGFSMRDLGQQQAFGSRPVNPALLRTLSEPLSSGARPRGGPKKSGDARRAVPPHDPGAPAPDRDLWPFIPRPGLPGRPSRPGAPTAPPGRLKRSYSHGDRPTRGHYSYGVEPGQQIDARGRVVRYRHGDPLEPGAFDGRFPRGDPTNARAQRAAGERR